MDRRSAREPRVILIGGPPGAGKSTLGRALSAHLGWPNLTGDDLVVGAAAVTDATTQPALHVMRGIGHVAYFTQGPDERLISDAINLQDTFWPAIERVARKYVVANEPLILDWWLLSPAKVARLNLPVASFWIHIDEQTLTDRERANVGFFGQSTEPDRMLASFMARSLWRNQLVMDEAQHAGLPILSQDGSTPVEELVDQVVKALDGIG